MSEERTYINVIRKVFCAEDVSMCLCGLAIGAVNGSTLCRNHFLNDDIVINPGKFSELHKHLESDDLSLEKLKEHEEYQKGIAMFAAHELNPETFTDEDWVIVGEHSCKGLKMASLRDSLCHAISKAKDEKELYKIIENYKQSGIGNEEEDDDDDSDIVFTDPANPLPDITFCLSYKNVPFLAKDDITAIKAKAKNGKTHLCSLFVAALISPSGYCLGLKRIQQEHPLRVLYVDTEQSAKYTENLHVSTLKLAGADTSKKSPHLEMINMRKVQKSKRLKKIELIVARGNYDVVFIDGLKDLVRDFNDNVEAVDIVEQLTRFAENYHINLCTVLHENPSKDNSKMKGHTGSELVDKATEVFEIIKKENKIFEVNSTDMRLQEVPTFAFKFNDEGEMESYFVLSGNNTEEVNPTESKAQLSEIYWDNVFKDDEYLCNKDIAKRLRVSPQTVTGYTKIAKHEGLLLQKDKDNRNSPWFRVYKTSQSNEESEDDSD